MTLDELVKLANAGAYDELLGALEKLPPRMMVRFGRAFAAQGKDTYDDLIVYFTDEQRKRLKWLDSSEREREYLMAIPDEEMTDEDWFDLRAQADF